MVNEQSTPMELRFAIEYLEPDPRMATYANQMVVYHTSDEFVLVFYRLLPGSALVTAPEKLIDVPSSLPAEPVARIVVPIGKLESFAQAVQANLESYLANRSIPANEAEE
jgi:hypothetical protein